MITLCFMALAAIAKAIMDTLQFHFPVSIFKKLNAEIWDHQISHKNKYYNKNKEEGPAFIGSTTVFVFLTDMWHFTQMVFLLCITASIIFYTPVLSSLSDFLLISVIFRGVFMLFYKYILV